MGEIKPRICFGPGGGIIKKETLRLQKEKETSMRVGGFLYGREILEARPCGDMEIEARNKRSASLRPRWHCLERKLGLCPCKVPKVMVRAPQDKAWNYLLGNEGKGSRLIMPNLFSSRNLSCSTFIRGSTIEGPPTASRSKKGMGLASTDWYD